MLWLCFASSVVWASVAALAQDVPEYRLKAAFIYNFILFTQWPSPTGESFNLCIYGKDPFGPEIDTLEGKVAAGRTINVQRKAGGESLTGCQGVFIAHSEVDSLPLVLEEIRDKGVLTVADSPGAVQRGVALNMVTNGARVSFQANVIAAREAGLALSSKLLRLATEVVQ